VSQSPDFQSIRLLVLDVDGVMTDGSIILDDMGRETKSFHVRDGLGIRVWQKMGGEVAIITGRSSQVVSYRSAEAGRCRQGGRIANSFAVALAEK